jgi:hypothetical protein
MIQVFDDFLANPDVVRQSAIASGFGTWRPNKGDVGLDAYAGMNFWGNHSTIIRGLWERLGPVFPNDMFFRITNPSTDKALVHSDRASGDFTALVYLSPDREDSGTGFYRHRETGMVDMPSLADLMKDKPFFEKLYAEMLLASDEHWEMMEFVEAKFNRCVVFDAPKFHCRHPKEGYGTTESNSRMVWASHFFKESVNG